LFAVCFCSPFLPFLHGFFDNGMSKAMIEAASQPLLEIASPPLYTPTV
jgi:hypothetical protein